MNATARVLSKKPVRAATATAILTSSATAGSNSMGIWMAPIIDAIRCMKKALDRHQVGYILAFSTFFMKSPRMQCGDFERCDMLKAWLS